MIIELTLLVLLHKFYIIIPFLFYDHSFLCLLNIAYIISAAFICKNEVPWEAQTGVLTLRM